MTLFKLLQGCNMHTHTTAIACFQRRHSVLANAGIVLSSHSLVGMYQAASTSSSVLVSADRLSIRHRLSPTSNSVATLPFVRFRCQGRWPSV